MKPTEAPGGEQKEPYDHLISKCLDCVDAQVPMLTLWDPLYFRNQY